VKTISLKKVSAVAVASLGFGLLSVAPAQAATITAWTQYESNVTSISLTSATSSPAVGSAVYVNVGAKTAAVGTVAGATTTGAITQLRGALISYPAGGFVQVTSSTNVAGASAGTPTVPTGTNVVIANTNNTGATGANSIFIRDADDAAGVAVYDVTTSATTGLASMTFTPAVAGTYELRVWNDGPAQGASTVGNNTIDSNEAVQSISITVAAASTYSAALSSMRSVLGDGGTAADSTTNLVPLVATEAMATTTRAAITVSLKNAANVAMTTGNTLTAVMSGVGGLGSTTGTADTPGATDCNATTVTRAKTHAADAVNTFTLCSDGTSGVGTVTISVTDVSGATTILGTKTITFYGTVATLSATVLQGISTAGVANGCTNDGTGNATTACNQTTLALTPAVVITAKDKNGVNVPALAVTGKSTDATIVASSAVTAVSGTGDKNGLGFYNASVTGGASANVGKSTTIVYSTIVSATLTISAPAVTIALAGAPSAVTWSLDKTAYAPGSPVSIVVTAKDSAGNNAADGTYANLFAGASTLGGAITGSTPAASVEILGGKATYTAYAPGTAGSYIISNKFGTSMPAAQQGGAISASVVVSDPNAAILTQIDALNAKIVALNALIAKIMKKLGVK